MDEEKEEINGMLIEVLNLLYVLEMALNNDSQKCNDIEPYADLTRLIKCKVADALDALELAQL